MLNQVMEARIERLTKFRERIVLLAFAKIKSTLEAEGHQVQISSPQLSTSRIESSFAELIEDISSTFPLDYFSANRIESIKSQRLLCGVLIDLKGIERTPKRPYTNKFCMGIEGHIQESGEIYGIASIYCTGIEQEIEQFTENLIVEREHQDIENISESDILTYFVNRYGAFRVKRLSEAPDLEVLLPSTETEQESQTTDLVESSPIVVERSNSQPQQENSIQDQKAAQAREQQNNVQNFLARQNLNDPIFKHLLPDDLKRLSELSDHLSSQRPQEMGEHQTAYDWLTQQASEFAFSLKPISGTEFADYLEVYRTMLANDCHLLLEHNPSQSYESIWIEQVKAYGEVDAPSRIRKAEAQHRRMMVQGVTQRFGKPDEFGQREWIGTTNIEIINVPPEQMIRMIKQRNEQREVRFEQLSYAILQMYRNGVHLPESERKLSSIVHSYLQSLKLTIGQARSSEVELQVSESGYEFSFSRVMSTGKGSVRATAIVMVERPFGKVTLRSYEFKPA